MVKSDNESDNEEVNDNELVDTELVCEICDDNKDNNENESEEEEEDIICKKCKRRFLEREKEKDTTSYKASLCSICNETLFTKLCMCFLKQD